LNFRLLISAAMLSAGLFTASGCGRASITFALGGDDGVLRETSVMESEAGKEGEGGKGGQGSGKVAQIDVRGLIIDSTRSGLFGEGTNPVDDLVARLDKAAADPEVRAVLLRINSPGGGVAASETMYNEVRRFRLKSGKPVVVSMGEVAASGGYYLSLAADETFAQPTTITGSIGVIIPSINISAAMNRWGIVSRSIKSGVNKDLGNPLEPMREGQYAVLQGMVDEFYASFRGLVIERRSPRGLVMAEVDQLTDGRVLTGTAAVKAGLVDYEGGIREAFERATRLAGLSSGRLVRYTTEAGPGGRRPRTAYAQTDDAAEASGTRSGGGIFGGGPGDFNLLKLDLGESLMGLPTGGMNGGAGIYYLWAPNLP